MTVHANLKELFHISDMISTDTFPWRRNSFTLLEKKNFFSFKILNSSFVIQVTFFILKHDQFFLVHFHKFSDCLPRKSNLNILN